MKMKEEKSLSSVEFRFTGSAEDPFAGALKKQMELHEGMTFIDLLKFLYQSSLGPFHIFEMMDKIRLMDWIRENLEKVEPSDGPLIESLYGNKWVRVNLGSYRKKYGCDYQRLYEIFMRAKNMKKKRMSEFIELQKKLVDNIRKGKIRPIFDESRILLLVENFLKRYEESGYPPVHHSATYMLKNNSEYLVVPYSAFTD